ncbi:MAG: MFS transporter [Candidatus Aquiluna sp.]|nr:MFS transporter [Aquiluna sp.]
MAEMPLRTQKLFALAAIVLLALNLRTAVGSLSPVVNYIQQDIALPIVTIGLLGVAAPLAFAISTSLAYRPARRYGVELTLVITVLAIIAGHLFRALAWDSTSLFVGSMLSLLGMGVGNVLLPVLVRKYFPNRIGQISSIYITMTAISASSGSFFAVPVAEAAGWRLSLGQWALLAALTLLPLLAIRANSEEVKEPKLEGQKAIWRSPTALAIGVVQGMTSVFGYVSFAWLPILLIEHIGASEFEGGSLLALFAIMGLPVSLIVPVLADKYQRSHSLIVYFSATMGSIGALGLLFGSTSLAWLFVACLGLGPTMFPLALTLFNLRSRTRATVLAVSAFGQGVSYTLATLMVFLVGIFREVTGGWELTLWLLFVVAAGSSIAGIQLAKHNYVDDELR